MLYYWEFCPQFNFTYSLFLKSSHHGLVGKQYSSIGLLTVVGNFNISATIVKYKCSDSSVDQVYGSLHSLVYYKKM